MGHSEGQNVTEGYIGRTPLDKMFEYNNALLDLNHAKPKQLENVTAKDIKKMSKKEIPELFAKFEEEKGNAVHYQRSDVKVFIFGRWFENNTQIFGISYLFS